MADQDHSEGQEEMISIEDLAWQVHEQFCERSYAVPFDVFRDEFIAAARQLQEIDGDLDTFMTAQTTSGKQWIDPEDLVGPQAVERYRMIVSAIGIESIQHFQLSLNQFERFRRNVGPKLSNYRLLKEFPSSTPEFTVVMAMRLPLTPEERADIITSYAEWALPKLQRSHKLRKFIAEKLGLDMEKLVQILADIVAEQGQISSREQQP